MHPTDPKYREVLPQEENQSRSTDLTRREFIAQTGRFSGALAAGLALGTLGSSAASRIPNSVPELVMMNALDLSKAIKLKQVSCHEVMKTFLGHIGRFNPKVNAIVSLQDQDDLLKQAGERDEQLASGKYLGWMHGFPHAVKDLAATKGIRTTWGSPLLDSVPQHDSLFVERLRASGVVIIGKTNAPEFGLGSQTYNSIFGATLNAYDQSKTSGGSSGGASVSLALRMLPVADGSDMMGSLRNPAAFNNVIGFRPSYGRVPSCGGELFLDQLSTEGPIGRSVADVAMLLSVMAGPYPGAPLSIEQDPIVFTESLKRDFKGTRLGWLGNLRGHLPVEPGIMELCQRSFAAFEGVGCSVEDVPLNFPPNRMWESWVALRHWSVAADLFDLYKDPEKRQKMKSEAQWEVEGGLKLSAMNVSNAGLARSDWYRAILNLFQNYDYLMLPGVQVFPFGVNTHWPKEINGVKMDTYHRWMEVMIPGTLSGCPVINVPVGFNAKGLPMGLQIIGKNHADLAVLQLAYAYEQSTNWVRDHLPPLLNQA